METLRGEDPAWIVLAEPAQLTERLAALARQLEAAGGDLAALPLYGVPFAIKDNIAACLAFAYLAEADATVVARLQAAGAVLLGKTNLDQFATGLVGVRSPFGAVPNAFDPAYVSGGSSSGSASVVARGLVPLSRPLGAGAPTWRRCAGAEPMASRPSRLAETV